MKLVTRLKQTLLIITTLLASAVSARADLQGDVQAVLRDKLLAKAQVGIQVVQLSTDPSADRTLFTHNHEKPLIPASNMKVITTSAALDVLGADFRFRTFLVRRDRDLILVGDGDPSFGDAELLKKSGWGVTTVFQNWAEHLKKAGVNEVRAVLVDDSVFDTTFAHPRWPADQQQYRYACQVGGMNLNVNCVDFYFHPKAAGQLASFALAPATRYVTVENQCRSGGENAIALVRQSQTNKIVARGTCPVANQSPVSMTIHDPPLFGATVLSETLAAAGIKVAEPPVRDRTVREKIMQKPALAGYSVVAIHETPLSQVLARANKDSMNLYAESLCKRTGHAASGQSGSWENGAAASAAFLKKTGADPAQFRLDDGSGLSRQNAVSARTMMHVLRYNFHGKQREAFVSSLAVGGVDGTLDNRFQSMRGRVMAKTGYISGVSALSGYLKTDDGRWYAFAILMNGVPAGSNSRAKALQENIVKAIDTEARRTR